MSGPNNSQPTPQRPQRIARPAQRVRAHLHACCQHPGLVLPSQADLAKELDASPRTVARVVAELVASGDIETIPGLGMRIKPELSSSHEPANLPKAKLMQVSEIRRSYEGATNWLLEQIERGTWPPGTVLPTRRVIKAACGVGSINLQRAFDVLSRQGHIHRRGRHYYVGPQLPPSDQIAQHYANVWMVAPGADAEEIAHRGGRYITNPAQLEATCQSFGLSLQARNWRELEFEHPPHALLAVLNGTTLGSNLTHALQRLRKRRQDLRLVTVNGRGA